LRQNNEDAWLQQMKDQEYDWLLLLKTSPGQASIFGYKREKKCKAKSILIKLQINFI
jgi:hypothetical protein